MFFFIPKPPVQPELQTTPLPSSGFASSATDRKVTEVASQQLTNRTFTMAPSPPSIGSYPQPSARPIVTSEWKKRGCDALDRGDKEGAKKCFKRAIEDALNNDLHKKKPLTVADLWKNLADCLEDREGICLTINKKERWFLEIDCYMWIVALDPTDAFAWNELGLLSSSFDKKIEFFKKAVEQGLKADLDKTQPTHLAIYWINLADQLEYSERVSLTTKIKRRLYSKKDCYEEALVLDPTNSSIWNELGLLSPFVRERVYFFKKAVEQGLKADLDKTQPTRLAIYWINLADHLEYGEEVSLTTKTECRSYSKRTCYEQAILLDPSNAYARNQLVLFLLSCTKQKTFLKQAIEQFGEPDSKGEKAIHAIYWLILESCLEDEEEISLTINQKQETYTKKRCCEKVVLLNPTSAPAWNRLGLLSSSPEQKKEFFKKAVEHCGEPNSKEEKATIVNYWDNLAKSLEEKEEISLTINQKQETYTQKSCCKKMVLLDPANASTWNKLGLLSSSPEEKKECFKQAVEQSEESNSKSEEVIVASYWSNLASSLEGEEGISLTINYRQETYTKRGCYEKALLLDPSNASAWNGLGLLSSSPERKKEYFKKAVESDPKNSTYWINFAHSIPADTKETVKLPEKTLTLSRQQCYQKACSLACSLSKEKPIDFEAIDFQAVERVKDDSIEGMRKRYLALGENKWMECIDGTFHEHGKFVFDRGLHKGIVEPGFVGSMEKAFRFVSDTLGKPMTPEWYLELHKITCAHLAQETLGGDVTHMKQSQIGEFRHIKNDICFPDQTMSEGGIEEFKKSNFGELEFHSDVTYTINYTSLNSSDVCAKQKAYMDEYYKKLENGEDPLTTIAWFYQQNEWLHPTVDGCGRTDMAVLNKLLTENGYHPAILDSPYVSTIHELDFWTEYLRLGLIKWEIVAKGISTESTKT